MVLGAGAGGGMFIMYIFFILFIFFQKHPSIIGEGNTLQMIKYTPLQFGCPLCPKFKTTREKTLMNHLNNHKENGVHFQSKLIEKYYDSIPS